jgi:hypothetical protein
MEYIPGAKDELNNRRFQTLGKFVTKDWTLQRYSKIFSFDLERWNKFWQVMSRHQRDAVASQFNV